MYLSSALETGSFTAGQQLATFDVTPTTDLKVEADETFTVALGTVSGGYGSVTAAATSRQGTIDNDDQAQFTIRQDESGFEDAGVIQFTVDLSNPVDEATSVTVSSSDGTALVSDSDYTPLAAHVVNFTAGQQLATFDVTPTTDLKVEADETFTVALGTVSGGYGSVTAAATSRQGTIDNDDQAQFTIRQDESGFEDAGVIQFTVDLSNPVDEATSVTVSSSDGTALVSDSDYTPLAAHVVNFTAGQQLATFDVTPTTDLKVEADETFTVALGTVSGGYGSVTASATSRTGTITNDDQTTLTLSGLEVCQLEGSTVGGTTAFTFEVRLTNPVQGGFNVGYTTNDGTAKLADGDYQDNDGSQAFAGTLNESHTLTVLVNHDAKVEADELFDMALGAVSGLGTGVDVNDITVNAGPVAATITNDDFLAGLVFDDLDNDGAFEPPDGDAGIEGVSMQLVHETSGTVVDTDTTDASGRYEFDTTLAAGTYKIVEMVDELADLCLLDGIERAGVNGGTVNNSEDSNEITGIDVSGNGTVDEEAMDYLFAEIGRSEVFGTVWRDFNNDGVIDFGEKGIDGVTLTLSGTDDRGNTVSDNAETETDGSYAFINLRPGTYAIQETQPAGFDDGQESLGKVIDQGVPTAVANPGVIDGNDKFSGIQLVPKSEGDMYNFGERPQAGGEIGDNTTATIGFWHNKNGQALIKSLNGDLNSTQLGDWLAATLPNMYGPDASYDAANGDVQHMDLTGKNNQEIAEIFKYLHKRNKKTAVTGGPVKTDAQVLALALSTYSTSETLAGGDYAASYGFNTSTDGISYTTFNVLSVLNVQEADHLGLTPVMDAAGNVTIMDILLKSNEKAHEGLLYDDDDSGSIDSFEKILRTLANELFTAINEGSDI